MSRLMENILYHNSHKLRRQRLVSVGDRVIYRNEPYYLLGWNSALDVLYIARLLECRGSVSSRKVKAADVGMFFSAE